MRCGANPEYDTCCIFRVCPLPAVAESCIFFANGTRQFPFCLILTVPNQYKSAGDKIGSGEVNAMSNTSDGHSSKADELIKFASEIVAAYVSNNPIPVSEIPGMIKSMHATLGGLAGGTRWRSADTRRSPPCRSRNR